MSVIGARAQVSAGDKPLRKIDPVSIEVLANALDSIVEDAGEVLIRSSHSPTVKERRDSSTALFDSEGRALCQAAHIPLHFGSLFGIVELITAHYPPSTIREGDIFIGNDAYEGGGTHLNDIVLVEPIFVDGGIVAWTTNVAHHADFFDRGHAHIFQEGLRIPPVKLYKSGVLEEGVQKLILLNTQVPEERLSDIRAQVSANRFAIDRFRHLCAKYGTDFMRDASAALLDSAERRMRAGIAEIPDGVYEFEDDFDHPEVSEIFRFGVTATVRGDELDLAFRAPPQVRASLNLVNSALAAASYYAVKAIADPYGPANSGLFRPISITAPSGSMLNAAAPAAVYGRACAAQRVVDLVHGALAQAVPHKVTAAHNGSVTGNTYSGIHPQTGHLYIYGETMGGGGGAGHSRDGLDGVHVHITNSANMPIETLEMEYPMVVERYELTTDSGGPGRHRGGMGIHRRIRVENHDCRVDVRGSRLHAGPWGLEGGLPGAPFSYRFEPPLKDPYKKYTLLHGGQRVSIFTPGGGGHGDPKRRDRALVLRDYREKRISRQAACEIYGMSPEELA